MMGSETFMAASVDIKTSTSRANWIENNAMPDSISMNMMGRSLLPPVQPRPYMGLTWRYTLKILNTIKPVTRTFTIKDMAREVAIIIAFPDLAATIEDGEMWNDPTDISASSQVAKDD